MACTNIRHQVNLVELGWYLLTISIQYEAFFLESALFIRHKHDKRHSLFAFLFLSRSLYLSLSFHLILSPRLILPTKCINLRISPNSSFSRFCSFMFLYIRNMNARLIHIAYRTLFWVKSLRTIVATYIFDLLYHSLSVRPVDLHIATESPPHPSRPPPLPPTVVQQPQKRHQQQRLHSPPAPGADADNADDDEDDNDEHVDDYHQRLAAVQIGQSASNHQHEQQPQLLLSHSKSHANIGASSTAAVARDEQQQQQQKQIHPNHHRGYSTGSNRKQPTVSEYLERNGSGYLGPPQRAVVQQQRGGGSNSPTDSPGDGDSLKGISGIMGMWNGNKRESESVQFGCYIFITTTVFSHVQIQMAAGRCYCR